MRSSRPALAAAMLLSTALATPALADPGTAMPPDGTPAAPQDGTATTANAAAASPNGAIPATPAAGADTPGAHTPGATPPEQVEVQAERRNRTQLIQGGQLGALGTLSGLDAPFDVRSYTSSLIRNQQDETLGQVLENDPSVQTSLGYGNYSEVFVIRGFQVDIDDVSIDGLYGIAPRQLVDPYLYDEVQILDGAGAFINGAAPGGSAIGGNINLTMKRAGDTPLTRLTGTYASGSLGGGELDVGRRFGHDDMIGVRVNASGYSGNTAVDGEHHDSAVVGVGIDLRRDRLRASVDLDYQNKGIADGRDSVLLGNVDAVPAPPRPSHNYSQPWTYTRLRDRFGLAHVEYDLLPQATLYAAGGLRSSNENGDYSSVTATNAETGAGTLSLLSVPRTDFNRSVRGGVRAVVDTGPITHHLDLGGSAIWETGDYAYAGYFTPIATNLYDTPAVPRPVSNFFGGNNFEPFPIERTDLASVYGSDRITVLHDRAELIVGVREQQLLVKNYAYADGSESSRYDKSQATPVVGVVVHPTAHTSLYFNRVEGLSPGPTAPINTTNFGEVFPPYVSTQYEVGAKLDTRLVSSTLAFYQLSQPDAYTQVNANDTDTYVVNGNERHRGIEWSVTTEPVRGLRIIGGAAYIDPRQLDTGSALTDGKQAIGVPDYKLNANVEYDLFFLPGATLTGAATHVGSQQVTATNTLQLPPWTEFDLGARYTFLAARRPFTARFGVLNIADERYWASAIGGYLTQGAPRTYEFSLEVDL